MTQTKQPPINPERFKLASTALGESLAALRACQFKSPSGTPAEATPESSVSRLWPVGPGHPRAAIDHPRRGKVADRAWTAISLQLCANPSLRDLLTRSSCRPPAGPPCAGPRRVLSPSVGVLLFVHRPRPRQRLRRRSGIRREAGRPRSRAGSQEAPYARAVRCRRGCRGAPCPASSHAS